MSNISREDIIKACEETGFDYVGYPGGIEDLRGTINERWQNHIQDPKMIGAARPVKYKYEWLVSELNDLLADEE